jgi:hypothetical protein
MRARVLSALAVAVLFLYPLSARPAENPPDAKNATVIVRIKSINDLMEDAKYLAKLGGKEQDIDRASDFIDANASQDKGLLGVDPKRPLGLFGFLNANSPTDSSIVALVPVADEKAVLGNLKAFNVAAEKDDNDIYEVTLPGRGLPVPVYFRFSHGYCFVTAKSKRTLAEDRLPDPAKFLDRAHPTTVSATFRLDEIPESVKQILLGQIEMHLAQDEEREESDQNPAHRKLHKEAHEALAEHLSTLIKEGGRLDLRFDIDRKANKLFAEVRLAGQDKSDLKAEIADLAKLTSHFGAWPDAGHAVDLLLHLALPEKLKGALSAAINEGVQKGLKKEKDETKREQARKFFKAAGPTLKSGDLDLAVTLRGPDADSHYTLLAGLRLHDGKAIDSALQDLVGNLPKKERAKIHFNAETVAGFAVHRLDVEKHLDADAKRTLGEHPIYVAFGDDAVVLAGGPDALSALKDAAAAEPKPAPLFDLGISMSRFAPAMVKSQDPEAIREGKKIIKEAFTDSGRDRVQLAISGGEALGLRFSMDAAVARFFRKANDHPEIFDVKKPRAVHKAKDAKRKPKGDESGDDDN